MVLVAVAVVASLVCIGVGSNDGLPSTGRSPRHTVPLRTPGSPSPATDVALTGGGISDGGKCGVKGFHHFALPAASASTVSFSDAQRDAPPPGPQLVLGSYGFAKDSFKDPGHFTISLLLASGGSQPMDLSPPLGPQGVAVEIEGPDGLVGGAYGLPVTLDDGTPRTARGEISIGPDGGGTAQVTLPAQALCPGIDGLAVQQRLSAPVDSTNTVTGQPPYTLSLSQ